MKKKLLLIDGNSIVNRAFFAMPLLTNKSGEYTNAVFGFMHIFLKLYDEESPDCVAVAFDLPFPTFRHEMYDEYKGTRKSMPIELRPQMPLLKNLLKKMNVEIYETKGYEADDVIGTLSLHAKNSGLSCVIVSGDRDMLQLAGDDTLIRIPKTKSGKTEIENYYARDVYEKTGVTPDEIIEVKALMGDASDNIPGVPGIGEKTAQKIIIEYKSVENAIANADKIKPAKAAENLKNHADTARLSRELSTIRLDVPMSPEFNGVESGRIFNAEALEEIKRLEFKSLVPRFEKTAAAYKTAMPGSSKIIDNKNETETYVNSLVIQNRAAFYSVIIDEKFHGISFYNENGESPVFIKPSGDFDERALMEACRPFFESGAEKLTHDSKREMKVLSGFGIGINNLIFDAALAGYVLDSSKNSYNCDDIAFDYLGETIGNPNAAGKNKRKPAEIPESEIIDFALANVGVIYRAYPVMLEMMKKNNQTGLYFDIELPLSEILFEMENAGIRIDRNALNEFGKTLEGLLSGLVNQIYEHAGENFNINSTMQLGAILFEKLKLRGSKKTRTGFSTDAEVLEKLKNEHAIIPLIQEYRMYSKLKSTYVDGLLPLISSSGRIHSTFNQTVTTTGRISSSEPNLQNIPVRLPLGRNLRKSFVPDDGFIFIGADYSQIELRVLAHMSDDSTLINAFNENQDIHRLTASQVFNAAYDDVTPEQRGAAKAVNFGIVYGIGAFSLSEDIGVSVREAEKYINGYFLKYPRVKEFMDDSVKKAAELGYAETIFGRRRTIPELKHSNFIQRSFGERAAMNMPVQGSAADIIKIAMINVYKRLKENNLRTRIILQIHDELLLEADKNEVETVKKILKDEMENCVKLSVPLVTEQSEGETWYDAK